ncbi:MAG: DUF3050 domain-containing protein [Gammaproteobacteria bacterium]|nr:DUF3050 domain-containing protein [Gammaproteobacteria bacterium]
MSFSQLSAAVVAAKTALAEHAIYRVVDSTAKLKVFVAHHVACVWDFMSLLKSLQSDLAPVRVPWFPPADPEAARLVNEIVLDEECDRLTYREGHASHFVWYTEAMVELGVDTGPVRRFLAALQRGADPVVAMRESGFPTASCVFTAATLAYLSEPLAVRAAVFMHGREDLVPRMFRPLVASLREKGIPCGRLAGYLDRHIEVDAAHGDNASALLERLYAAAPAERVRAETGALAALNARLKLWDAIVKACAEVD